MICCLSSCIVHLNFLVTIAEAIHKAAAKLAASGVRTDRLDAEVLLRHVLGRDRAWIIAHGNEPLDGEKLANFESLIERRAKREPLQYITRVQEFWGLEFAVTQDVLIPRPETELAVEAALRTTAGNPSPVIVDLCTGSGCIAVSVAKEIPGARIFAADKSERALEVARENARRHGVSGRIRFLEGDLFEPLRELDLRGRVDLIVTNPPYVRTGDLPTLMPEVRHFEPEVALFAGPKGTEVQERIIITAPEFLKKNGTLIMEMAMDQSETLIRMVRESGAYGIPEVLKDLAGIERVIVAKKL